MKLWMTLGVTFALLAGVLTFLINGPLKRRLQAGQRGVLSLLPILATGLGWMAATTLGQGQAAYEDWRAPESNILAFVEDVEFGMPDIPATYLEARALGESEMREISALFDRDEEITLSPEEAARLNDIAKGSGMVDSVTSERPYQLREIGKLLLHPMRFYYFYGTWATALKEWATSLAAKDIGGGGASLDSLVKDRVATVTSAPGLFQAILGIAARNSISLEPAPGDCPTTDVPWLELVEEDGEIRLSFSTFAMHLASASETRRAREARKLGKLFEGSCVTTLARVFSDSAPEVEIEPRLMKRYVAEWQAILRARQPEHLQIKVAVSNIGRHDGFLRREVKVGIGSEGRAAAISVVCRAAGEKEPFVPVKSREARSILFEARLNEDQRGKLHAAYTSGLNYVRVGLLTSAGGNEATVYSPSAPFSGEAKKSFASRIETISVGL